MQVVLKFKLPEEPGVHVLDLPEAWYPSPPQYQEGTGVVLWAVCDTRKQASVKQKLQVIYTGQPFNLICTNSLGPVQLPNGIVVHYFKELH